MSRGRLFAALLCFYAGCVVWFGALVFFALVAGVPFELLSRDTAGVINRMMLARLHVLEAFGAFLLATGLWLLNLRIRGWRWRVSLLIFVVMLTLFGVYAGLLEPMMNAIARQVSFEHPTAEMAAAIARFEGYHRLYSILVSLNAFFGLCLFLWQTWLLVHWVSEGAPGAG